MKRGSDLRLSLATVGMDLCVLCAWASFSLVAIARQTSPLPHAVVAFVAALLVTSGSLRLGWRNIQRLTLHGAGLCVMGFATAHSLWYRLADLGRQQRPTDAWLGMALSLAWMFAFWIAGALEARRSQAYRAVCSRFSRGLAWLFALLFTKLLTRGSLASHAGAVDVSDATILPFFVCGLMAVALARNGRGGRTISHRGYRGLGLAMGFGATIVSCASGALLIFLPCLRAASETVYAGLTYVGEPLASALARGLLSLLDIRLKPPPLQPGALRSTGAPSTGSAAPDRSPGDDLLQTDGSASWLVFALALAGLAWLARRWLFAEAENPPAAVSSDDGFLRRLERALAWLRALVRRWLAPAQRHESIRLYGALLAWGRRSGIPCRANETPLEYARRLKRQLNVASREIDLIVAALNAHVYGQAPYHPHESTEARRALRRLHSPRLWPTRLATWVCGD
jgi:hypothetical protein